MKFKCSAAIVNLISFIAVLVTIVIIVLYGVNDAALSTGLIGVLGSFRPNNSAQNKDNE